MIRMLDEQCPPTSIPDPADPSRGDPSATGPAVPPRHIRAVNITSRRSIPETGRYRPAAAHTRRFPPEPPAGAGDARSISGYGGDTPLSCLFCHACLPGLRPPASSTGKRASPRCSPVGGQKTSQRAKAGVVVRVTPRGPASSHRGPRQTGIRGPRQTGIPISRLPRKHPPKK